MNKIALLPLILTFTTAAAGCGKVAPKASDAVQGTPPATETTAAAVAETTASQPQTEAQTEDAFEYEFRESSAVVTKYTGNSAEVTVPAQVDGVPVTEIGFYAFEASFDITAVALPDTITYIGEGAFMDCSSLKSINIPAGATGIDRGAFVGCSSLESIDIPESVEYVREEAFTGCGSMTALNIMNPDLAYESWGLEDIPGLTIYAPDGSAVIGWASELGLAYDIL